jgi:hypothetical protein
LVSTGSGIYEATWLDTLGARGRVNGDGGYGGPDVLRVLVFPDGHAGPGEVPCAVRAAAVNPAETFSRLGLHHELPKDFAPSAVNDAPVTCDLVTFEAPQLADVH